MNNSTFFSQEGISYMDNFENESLSKESVEYKRWAILNYLAKHPKSSKYKVGKKLKISYTQIHQIFRELEFARVIISERITLENGEIGFGYSIPTFVSADKLKEDQK